MTKAFELYDLGVLEGASDKGNVPSSMCSLDTMIFQHFQIWTASDAKFSTRTLTVYERKCS